MNFFSTGIRGLSKTDMMRSSIHKDEIQDTLQTLISNIQLNEINLCGDVYKVGY